MTDGANRITHGLGMKAKIYKLQVKVDYGYLAIASIAFAKSFNGSSKLGFAGSDFNTQSSLRFSRQWSGFNMCSTNRPYPRFGVSLHRPHCCIDKSAMT